MIAVALAILAGAVATAIFISRDPAPQAARVLIEGESEPLDLGPGLFQRSPVIDDAIRRLGLGDPGPIGFQQDEDWALSLCLNPFFLSVEHGKITVYNTRIEFSPSEGPLVTSVIPVGKLRIRDRNNLVHAMGGTPFRVQATWRMEWRCGFPPVAVDGVGHPTTRALDAYRRSDYTPMH